MENPLQHIVLTDEQDQIENFKMQLQAMLPNLYSFSFFFFDTPKLGQAIKDFVKTELTSAGYESEWYENPNGEILNEILTKDFSKEIAVWYFDQIPQNPQFINNLNGKRDFLINNAQKLIIISTNDLYQSWFRDAYDFVSRAFGGIYRYHDVTQYFVNEIPQMPEREMKLARIRKEVEELKMLEMDEQIANRLLNLSEQADVLSDCPLAIEIINLILNFPSLSTVTNSRLGISLAHLGNFELAYKYFKLDEKKLKNSNDFNNIATNYGNQAIILKTWGKLEAALKLHKKEQILFTKIKDLDGLAFSFANQATIYSELKNFEKAIGMRYHARKIWEKLGREVELAKCLKDEAAYFLQIKDFEKAMEFSNKSVDLSIKNNDKRNLAGTYSIQACILAKINRLEESFNLFKFEEKLVLEIEDKKALVINYLNQANLLIYDFNKKDAGISLLKKTLIMAKEMGLSKEIKWIENILKTIN